MARTNGPFGPPGAPVRRLPAEGPYTASPAGQPLGQRPMQGYHFPPAEPEPNYGYNPQLLPSQQWAEPADQRAYDLGNYPPPGMQPYSDPGPFQQTSYHQQHPYADADADYRDEFLDEEEPRRGRRWMFIAAALVGAIGVGGALAYTYRSWVAAGAPRVPLPYVKAEPSAKVRAKEAAGSDKKLANRGLESGGPPQGADQGSEGADAPAGEEKNVGPRVVKPIPIGPQGAQVQPPPAVSVPGIMLQGGPPPRVEPPPQATVKAVPPPAPRVTIGERPPPAPADDEPDAPAQVKKLAAPPPVVIPRPAPAPAKASAGIGWVAVLSSQPTHQKAMEVLADIGDKYPDVLANKAPEVQEADLSASGKGTYYRLVVGPPGSRDAAMRICTQVKPTVKDCWVKEY